VGDEPAIVDRVAGESATQMIVDTALADTVEAEHDQVEAATIAGA
jgi:hypothetical protein